MPILPEYDAKANLDPGGTPGVSFDNSQFSAAADQGAAVQKLGNQGIELAQHFQMRQQQQEAYATKLNLDRWEQGIALEDQEALNKMPENGQGFADDRLKNRLEKSQQFLQSVPANLREQYAQRLALVNDQAHVKYAGIEAKQTATFATTTLNQALDGSKQALANNPEELEIRKADMAERIKLAPGIPESQKPDMIRAAQQDLMFVAAGKMAPTDPGAMAKMLGVSYQNKASGASDKESAAMTFFMSKGWTKEQAAGLVGNLIHESGGLKTSAVNPGDGRDGSDSIGIAQWNGTRAAALKQFAAAQGTSPNDFNTQLAFVDQELRTSEGSAGEKLRNAKTAAEAAAAVVTAYERPKGSDKGAANADGWGNRLGHAMRLAGGGVQVASAATASDAQPEAPAGDPRFAGLSYENKMKLIQQAQIGQAQQFKLQEQLATQQAAETEAKRTAWVDQQQYAASKGKLVLEQADADFQAGKYKSFEEYNSVVTQIKKADQDEANVRAGLQKLQTPGAVWTSDDKDILSAMDRKAGVPEAIQRGDQDAVTSMANRFRQTGMISGEVKQLFEGIPRSGSPAQVQFAMSALDQMYRSNPNAFEEAFGTTTRQNLTTWQGMIDKDPKAFQEELKRAGDPTTIKARKEVEKEGRKIASDLDDKKVLNAFVDHWFSFQPGKPYGTPDAPGMAALKVEFADTFATEYRVAGGDEKKAMDATMNRLKQTWAISPSSGDKLVKYAPELLVGKGFPAVNGSSQWLTDQVEAEVRKSGGEVPTWLGKKLGTVPGATRPTYSLWASEETQAEIDSIKNGRPLPDGRKSPNWTLVWEDPKTGIKRMKTFAFDVDSAIAERDKRAGGLQVEQDRSGVKSASEAALSILKQRGGSPEEIARLQADQDARQKMLSGRQ